MSNCPAYYIDRDGVETWDRYTALRGPLATLIGADAQAYQYLSRWAGKGGVSDLRKVIAMCEKMVELLESEPDLLDEYKKTVR